MTEYVTYFGELNEGDVFCDNDEPENFYICLGCLTDEDGEVYNALSLYDRTVTTFEDEHNVTRLDDVRLKVTFKN